MLHAASIRSGLRLEERGLRHVLAIRPASPPPEEQGNSRGPSARTGRWRRLAIRPGFTLTFYDLLTGDGFAAEDVMMPGLTMTILLDGDGEGVLRLSGRLASVPPITYAAGLVLFCYGEAPLLGRGQLPPGGRFRAAELRLDPSFAEDIGIREIFHRAGVTHPMFRAGGGDNWIGAAPTPEPLAHVTAWLAATVLEEEDDDDLLIEKSALDILAMSMELMRDPPGAVRPEPCDIAGLRKARGLLLSHPERPWTIAGLARRVGLNEKKLKSGFRMQLGTSVKGYLREVRLQRAHDLLEQPGCSVTEAALVVGYANPSHFAMLFRRRYGYPPSVIATTGETAAAPDVPRPRRPNADRP